MKKCLLILVLFFIQNFSGNAFSKRLQYGSDWNYQPILINGIEIESSSNASGGSQIIYKRYEAIKQVLDQFQKPFTVLDIGANNGFFSLKIAEDYDAICVMIDDTERLSDICTLNTDRNKIIHLQKRMTKNDLKQLEQKEHFDVILALLVLHHVDDWKTWVDTLFNLGDNVIIETPGLDDPINRFEHTKQLTRYLIALPNKIEIGSFPRGNSYDHLLWFNLTNLQNKKNGLGISYDTFFMLNGSFPKKSYVQELKAKIEKVYGTKKWLLQGIDYTLE